MQVIDAFGKQTVKKKKKVAPVIPTVTNKPPVTKAMDITPPVVTPFISSNDAAKAGTGKNFYTGQKTGTFEEGVAQRAKEAAELETKVALKDEGLTGSEVGSAVQPNTVDDLAARQKALQRDRLQASLQGLVNSAERSAGVETGKLTNEFRGAEGRLRTQDTMNRAGTDKFLNIGNLGQSGQVGQSPTAQNVITQGARSQQTAQEQELKAGIQRRLSEIKAQAAQDLSNFDFDVEIKELESQMRSAEAQAEYEQEKAILTESREYDDYLRQVKLADDREIALFEQQIEERNKEIDFEIEEAQANNDLVREVELTKEKAALDLQELAIRQAGDRNLEGQRQAGRVNLETQKQANRETLAGDTATDDGFLSDADLILNPVTIDTISDKDKDSLEKLINDSTIYDNDITKLRAILDDQGISIEEFEAYENWRDQALQAGN